MEVILVRARKGDEVATVEYDPAQGMDVLTSQIYSVFSNVGDEDYVMVDSAG